MNIHKVPAMNSTTASSQAEPVTHRQSPTRRDVYEVMGEEVKARSTSRGVVIFIAAAILYWVTYVAAAAAPLWWIQLFASIAMGVQASVLFAIGHDACHDSLTRRARLNRFIGTLAFLPALHPYTTWKHTHNGLHHGWTNVRGKDIVYVPFTKEEYDQLPAWRRLAERVFRSPLGFGALYFFTVYLPHELFPNKARGPKGRNAWRMFQWERVLVFAYALGLALGGATLAILFERPVWLSALLVTLVPGVVYFWMMGAVTFIHHTHPRAPWYAGENEFNYFGIVRATVHVEFPRPIEIFLHDILQHTAHHANTRIPMYNLAEAQRALEQTYEDEVVHEPWSWRGFLRTCRVCRLYDYEAHCWLDYDGTPSSESHLV